MVLHFDEAGTRLDINLQWVGIGEGVASAIRQLSTLSLGSSHVILEP
jgi:hypothetical protein